MTDPPDLRAIFAQEAADLLARLSSRALELERGEEETVRELFRAAHTLKGSATLVGLPAVVEVTHALEDLLSAVRDGSVPAGDPVVDATLDTVDALRRALPGLLAGDPAAVLDPALAVHLRALAAGAPPSAAAPPTAAAPSAPGRPEPPADPGPSGSVPPASSPRPQPDDARVAAGSWAPAPAAAAGPASAVPAVAVDMLPVPRERLDRLVRLAGESRTARRRVVEAIGAEQAADPDVEAAMAELDRTLESLQEQLLRARMVTLGAIAEPLRRAARDVARAAGKRVDYRLEGERIELDRGVLDALRDPLLHLVRNAVDHGLETPAVRRAVGKPETGVVRVRARTAGPTLVVEVSDDGAGLDLDALREVVDGDELPEADLVDRMFAPGVSTAEAVTDVSGRGVGLDIVRASLEGVRGAVDVHSIPGAGTTFTLTVPVTLAVVRCLLVQAAGERYALPAHAVITIAEAAQEAHVPLEGGAAIWVGGDIVPIVPLGEAVGAPDAGAGGGREAVVVRAQPGRVALRVDALLGQRDVTLQDLGDVLPRLPLVAGASVESDGTVLLVLDPVVLAGRAMGARRRGGPRPAAGVTTPAPAAADVLVVDDALTVRELQRSILERAGYRVRTASDGLEALARLAEARPDVVLTDIEMPNLDGFGLIEAIRARAELSSLPVLIMSSRNDPEDRARGLRVGADGYIVKQAFDAATLLAAVARVLGEEPPTA